MKKYLSFLLVALLITWGGASTVQAQSLTLAQAKEKGYVGEMANGLVGIVFSNPSDEVKQLVETTNKGRMAVYQQTAKEQGIDINQVRSIAAAKIYEKEKPGNYVQYNGTWGVK
jgi:uncharacterized protein YdbL (DUF1318 family)